MSFFHIWQVYLKKLGKIKMAAVTIATSNLGKTMFCWHTPANNYEKKKMIFYFNNVKV